MCLNWFRKKPTIGTEVEEVEEVEEIPITDVIMPANGQTAEEYLDTLRNTDTNEPKPTKTEAFYLVQKAGGAWDSIPMKCGDTSYQKLVPKPQGAYQYSYKGWIIKYMIRHDISTDAEEEKLIIPVIEIIEII
jgi:hypothetical protein